MEGSEATVLRTIYDSLVTLDDDGLPAPSLATEWEMVDEDTMEFRLRDGVRFQDGTPFDADAVKFNIDRAIAEESSTVQEQLSSVQKVTVVDPLTVRFVLSPPNPSALPITLADRAGMMASPTAVRAAGSSESFSDHPVGAGPYRVEGEWHPVESIQVRAWDGYWNADQRLLGGIDFTRVSLDASVNAMRSQDLDMQVVASGEVATLCAEDELRVSISPTNGLRVFLFNKAKAPFDDLRVRQAIAHGIDREAIAEVITNGLAKPAYQWFREGQEPYDSALDEMYPHDPEKAKDLLREAGYDDDNKLAFRSEIGSGATTYQRTGEMVQAELAKIGVEMDLQLVDRNVIVGRYFGLGGSDIKVWSSPLGAAGTAQPSDRFSKYFFADGTLNPAKVEVPGLQELVQRADSTSDPDERGKLLQEAARLITEDLASGLPLFFEPGITAYADYVGGIERGAFNDDLRFDGVYITEGRKPVGDRG